MTTILAIQGAPDAPDFSATPIIFGNDFKSDATGQITGVWYYHTNSNEPANVTVQVHRQSDQVLLGSKATTTSGLTDNAYNLINLDSAITYGTANQVVTISAYWPSGGFVYKTGASEHSANGLTAVIGGTGRFKNSGASELDYPTSTSANLACPVGMEFSTGATTVTGVAVAALGGLAAVASGVPVTLGTAAAALAGLTASAVGTVTEAAQAVGGSWYGLLSILAEARAMHEQQRNAPPVACPQDGEPLESVNGILHCRFDGWVSR